MVTNLLVPPKLAHLRKLALELLPVGDDSQLKEEQTPQLTEYHHPDGVEDRAVDQHQQVGGNHSGDNQDPVSVGVGERGLDAQLRQVKLLVGEAQPVHIVQELAGARQRLHQHVVVEEGLHHDNPEPEQYGDPGLLGVHAHGAVHKGAGLRAERVAHIQPDHAGDTPHVPAARLQREVGQVQDDVDHGGNEPGDGGIALEAGEQVRIVLGLDKLEEEEHQQHEEDDHPLGASHEAHEGNAVQVPKGDGLLDVVGVGALLGDHGAALDVHVLVLLLAGHQALLMVLVKLFAGSQLFHQCLILNKR